MTVGSLVSLSIEKDGLHIKLEPDGREYLDGLANRDDPDGWLFFGRPGSDIWYELLEPYSTNSGPEMLNSDSEDYLRLGALTDAPIIAYDVERDDYHNLISVGKVFWFPRYAVENELETMLVKGEVVFEDAEDG